MAVNLSPVGGVAAQFFDNNGIPLSGGLLYTYAAGTSTPLVTYTTQQQTVANSNPIVLDSAGRVPNEIWLQSTYSYKFVLTNSLGAQVWSYDNLVGINSNFTAYALQEQTFTATQGQTVFTLTGGIQYVPATNNLSVFVNGSKQIVFTNYIETSSTVVTFTSGLNVGDVVDFITAIPTSTSATSAANISYNEGGVGAITTNVQTKLRESVSVKDFGAVGDGVTNDTTAIQAALNSYNNIYFPTGTYKITSALVLNSNQYVFGDGNENTIINQITTSVYGFSAASKNNITIKNLSINGTSSGIADGVYFNTCTNSIVESCKITNFGHNGINFFSSQYCQAINNICSTNLIGGINIQGTSSVPSLYCKAIHNTCINNSASGAYGANILVYTNSNYCTVVENTCNSAIDGYGIGIQNSSFLIVSNNTCKNNTFSGINVSYTASPYSANFNVIDGNTCQGNTEHGICVQSNTSLSNIIVGHTITNNVCLSNGSVTSGKGIYLASGIREFSVVSNVCEYNTESGIEAAANCARGTITGNICINNGTAATSSASGIRISPTSTEGTAGCYDIVISSNVSEDTGANTQKYGIQLTDSSTQRIVVNANKLTGNTLGEVNSTATSCQIILYPSDGSIIPFTDQTQTLGTTVNRFSNVASSILTLVNSITPPAAVAGNAFLYVDSADGSFKIKFGNGTVKIIATNP